MMVDTVLPFRHVIQISGSNCFQMEVQSAVPDTSQVQTVLSTDTSQDLVVAVKYSH